MAQLLLAEVSVTRDDMIRKLCHVAPIITQVTGTTDMGFEFSAVVAKGVIYAQPGMLLDYSGGEFPPFGWEDKTDEEFESLLAEFLLDGSWEVKVWEHLSDGEIEHWFEEVRSKNGLEDISGRDMAKE